jgi:hypothetical protein
LDAAEAARRLTTGGRHEVVRAQGPSPGALVADQFQSSLIGLGDLFVRIHIRA